MKDRGLRLLFESIWAPLKRMFLNNLFVLLFQSSMWWQGVWLAL